jgi:hypothetical protein
VFFYSSRLALSNATCHASNGALKNGRRWFFLLYLWDMLLLFTLGTVKCELPRQQLAERHTNFLPARSIEMDVKFYRDPARSIETASSTLLRALN